jgi:hypothetical protein
LSELKNCVDNTYLGALAVGTTGLTLNSAVSIAPEDNYNEADDVEVTYDATLSAHIDENDTPGDDDDDDGIPGTDPQTIAGLEIGLVCTDDH